MKYKNNFHAFQEAYTTKYPNSLKMRGYLPLLKGRAILDVGCGSGIDMEFFKQQGVKSIAGADISQELLIIAKENVPYADIRNDNFSYLSWKNESFDVVWSKYALNCASDITPPLKELYRVCKKQGVVLLQVTHPIRTMNLLSSKDYFDEGRMIEYPTTDGNTFAEPHHTMAAWINNIIEAGFHIAHCEEIINKPKDEYKGVITPSAIIFVLKK